MASKSGMKELPSDRKFACTPKIIGVKRPQSLVNFLSIDHPSSNNSNKRQKRAIDSKWNVENVPELPCLHVKEKTSVTLFDTNIKTICEKIVASAQALSAYGQYYDEQAKATLEKDGMEFWIQLFNESDNCLVVEVGRKNGSSMIFHRVARTILTAIKSVHQSTKFGINDTEPPYPHELSSNSKCVEGNDKYASRMDVITSLLKNDRFDASLLGIQSLELLTNTRTASAGMISFVASIILSKEHEFGEIKEKVLSFIRNENESEDGNVLEESFLEKKRICAFSILSNSLNSISQRGQNGFESCINLDEWITGDDDDGACLLPILLKELKNAQISPQGAFHAAMCLQVLLEKSSTIRSKALDLDVTDAVLSSQKVGHCAHLMLGSISDNLVKILGEAK